MLGRRICWKMANFEFVVVVLAVFVTHVSAAAEQFVFQSAEYTIDETPGAPNTDTATVMISRTGSPAETILSKSITISTDCPTKVIATATETTDYSVSKTVTFAANQLEKAVQITIEDDDDEEFREFFCLTIVTDPGSEYTVRVYIPGNDYCVHIDTPASTTGNADDITSVDDVRYVGPWFVGAAGYPSVIDIDVQPESDGDADDIYIWLTENADQNSIGEYYGILLDDTIENTHTGGGMDGDGDSVLVKDGIGGAENLVGIISDSGGTISEVVTTSEHSFTLEYTEATGTVILEDQSDPSNKRYSGSSGASDNVDVNHLFVSSGNSQFASWKVCGLLPRKLPTIGTDSSGYLAGRSADKAIDGNRNPDFNLGGCFISSEASDPWIQIDLGREFDVKLVLIYPIESDSGTSDEDWLDDAKVYVGSCPSTSDASIKSNNPCDTDIGDVGGESVIEVTCSGKNYGRYVYIYKDTSSSEQINLCEVEVYGDDIPYGDQPIVEFEASTFQTSNDESAKAVTVTAKRTGSNGLTCTTADFYTDTITVPGGNSNDFTAVLSTSPYTFEWDADDDTAIENEKSYTIAITDDQECEPIETFNVYLTNVNGGILGDQSCSSVSIIDDDSVTYTLSQPTYKVSEGSSVNIGVSRSGTGTMQEGSAELAFADGTATSGDYANGAATVVFSASSPSPQYHTLLTVEDHVYEGDETLTVTLADLEPNTCSNIGSPTTATVTIEDDDSKFEWDVTDDNGFITISEGTAITSLGITREGVAQVKTININVGEEGASSSSDFSVSSSSVTFPANDDDESVTLTVLDDSVVEGDESFTLTLEDPNYRTGHKNLGEPYRLTVFIQDNDAEYFWSQSRYDVEESDGTVEVCLRRTGDTSTTKTIQINSAGSSALSGNDFTPLTEIAFSGSSEACANVAINNDNSVEYTEVFSVTIVSGQQDVALGSPSTASVYIADNDYTVNWKSTVYSFHETHASSVHYLTITKTGTGSPTVTITSQQETARQGIDYAPVSTSVTLGGSSAQIPITIYADDDYEPRETFTLTLSGTGVTPSTTRITITDNDPAPTEPPADTGLSAAVIAGIVSAAVVGAIVLVIAVMVFCVYSGMFDAFKGTAAKPATTHTAAAGPVAAQGFGLNYELSGLNSFGSGFYNGYGNGLINQGFQLGYQPALGYR